MNALLIIDMQQAYFQGGLQHDCEGVIARINRVAARMREQNNKVIFIQHDGDGRSTAAANTPGWEIYSGLTRKENDISISKTLNDAFANSNLETLLTQNNIQRLIIGGWATDFCVDSTIRSAISRGYNVVVLQDCHTLIDRSHLTAEKIIEHHNWLWRNLITANNTIELLTAQEFLG